MGMNPQQFLPLLAYAGYLALALPSANPITAFMHGQDQLVDTKQMEVKMGEVTIRVSAQRGDLLEMRRIDGAKYILIRAEDEVTVNGVSVRIP